MGNNIKNIRVAHEKLNSNTTGKMQQNFDSIKELKNNTRDLEES